MERIGTLDTICRYPVKSMGGEELEVAFVGFAGRMGDRVYAFERHPGAKGFPWHTGREEEDMVLFRPHYREGTAATMPMAVEKSFGIAPGVFQIYPGEASFELDVRRLRGGRCRCAHPSSRPSSSAAPGLR